MSSRRLNDLDPQFKPLAIELLARLVEAQILVLIVETTRTEAEHEANLVSGHSWIKRSKHIDGLAIDLCPYEIYTLEPGGDKLAWNLRADNALWERMGQIGEALGLRWGGRWAQRDLVHFEYVTPPPHEVRV